jgi:fumarate reductase flavoprotein subunit
MTILRPDDANFALTVPLVIVGAGACGLTAALAASEAGAELVVLERDPLPQGSTAMSSGMIPAAGTRLQAAKGVDDNPERFAADLRRKAKDLNDPKMVETIARASGPTVDWLAGERGIPLQLVEGFLYPGHSRLRMHAPPSKTGQALMDALRSAAETAGIEIICDAHVTALFADDTSRVHGLRFERPDGSTEDIGCAALILACNGFGGNAAMVARNIPEIADALFFGHVGNQGEGIGWGAALGAATRDMSGYQGHGSIAHPHGIQITWALMMEGGFQVNLRGARFSNEHQGYSEQAVSVQAQPEGVVFDIYDARIHTLGMTFDDCQDRGYGASTRRGDRAAGRGAGAHYCGNNSTRAGRGELSLRPRLYRSTCAGAAVLRRPRHRRAAAHPRRARDRCRRPGAARRRHGAAQPLRRRRRGARRLRTGRLGLPLGQRVADRNSAWPACRRRRGKAGSGGLRQLQPIEGVLRQKRSAS